MALELGFLCSPIVSETLLVFVRGACICGLDYIQPCVYLYVFVGSSCVFVVLITFMRVYSKAAVKGKSVSGDWELRIGGNSFNRCRQRSFLCGTLHLDLVKYSAIMMTWSNRPQNACNICNCCRRRSFLRGKVPSSVGYCCGGELWWHEATEHMMLATMQQSKIAAGNDPSCAACVLWSVGHCSDGFGKIFSNYSSMKLLSMKCLQQS